jgi:membrane associated rhomboid family serine protease
MTLAIAGVTAAVTALSALLGLDAVAGAWGSFVPARIDAAQGAEKLALMVLTPLSATLLHAGIAHLLFNLLFLLFCGRSVEVIVGGRQLVLLYLVGAYAAAMSHYFANQGDAVGGIGASGAISAVVGAYAMLFGRNRVKIANPHVAFWLNALWLALTWIVLQFIIGLAATLNRAPIGVAAHVGGFLAGLAIAKPLLLLRYRNA